MSRGKQWHLVCYDIRDHGRWRRAYELLKSYGQRLQYSIFRCRLTNKELEKLRWELGTVLASEDSILIIGLCDRCVNSIPLINRPEEWPTDDEGFIVI
jgi:CRISPR-associated protein Cas2